LNRDAEERQAGNREAMFFDAQFSRDDRQGQSNDRDQYSKRYAP
jgi:hypothetical protein